MKNYWNVESVKNQHIRGKSVKGRQWNPTEHFGVQLHNHHHKKEDIKEET